MVEEPVVFKGSSPKPPDSVSAMTGVPEKVVLDCVGVMFAEEAAVVSYFLRLLRAKAMNMRRPKPHKAIMPTVMLEMVAMPMLELPDSLTDLA